MIGRVPTVLAISVMATLWACSTGESGSDASSSAAKRSFASSGCRARASVPAGVSDRTMTSGGVEREFQMTVPKSYDGKRPLPLMLGLHALSIPHKVVAGMTGFADMATRYDFIGVAPAGRRDGAIPYWIAAPTRDNHDVAYIADLLDLLETEMCVDTARVYATGMSNGGQMSSLLACRLPDRFAAVAPVAGVEFSGGCRGAPVPVIAFHGTADPIVTYGGGGLNATRIADAQYWKGNVPPGLPQHQGVDAAMRTWAAHNGCDQEPVEEQVGAEVRRRSWRRCKADTILYVVDGGGHAWPGKPVPQFEASFGHGTTQIDASNLIFEFFFERPPR
jgi:polyhydroxybutyrate depolymerase